MYSQIDSNKRKSALLITIFLVLVIFLGYIIGQATGYGYNGILIAVIISIIMTLVSFYSGDKIALASAGAQGPIAQADNPYVYRLVENLSITAGLPMPKIYIIEDPAMNAFATGRDPKNASIALTTGIIKNLQNEELEGVIAHELSHVKNYDIRLMMLVIVLVGAITLLTDWFLRFNFFGRSHNRESNGNIFALVGLVLAILSPLFAQLIKLAISRKREFLADASGALLTRYPEGLARALEKISQNANIARVNKATAHLYIASPFSKKNISNLFSTHPPIDDRIQALRKMN
jgi:heat shock protein HtpX